MSRPSKWYYTGLDLGVKLAVEEKTLYLIEEGERDGWSQEFNRGLTDGYFEQVVEQLEEAGKEIEPICTQCDKVFDSEANSLHHLWVQHSEKATALFVVNRQETSSSSGNIVEFKAGRSRLEAGNGEGIRNVVAEQTKGLVFIKQIDDMVVHFYWKNRETGSVVMDLIVFPDDAEFKPVHGCPDGKVFMLKFKSSGEMKVFWLQDTSPDADKDLVKKVNDALNKPSTSRPSAFRSSGSNAKADRSAAGGSLISGQDFNAMGGLDQGQLISLIQSLQGKNSDSLPLPSSGSGGPHTAGSTEASSEADCEPPASSGASSSSSNAPLSFENPAIAKIFSNLQRKDAACLRKGLHVTYSFSRQRLLDLIHRCYDENFSYSHISGYESFYNSPLPFTIVMLLVPNIPHYFLAYCFRHKQNHDLKRKTMSVTTLKMHTTLRKVSTMKAFLPLFLLADVLIYFFCQLEFLPPQFIEYFLGTISSTINILNPVIAICCFRPYRKMFKEYYRLIVSKLSAHPKVMFLDGSSEEVVNL
uniref:Proteasomal ubiquitin receptor ADRM1 homolog n=2 Tax=Caenorhabditis tropicalis TaxID=1561998 RepID=A0A1I7TMN0_9PELO